jgi:hypothetical protein
VIEFLWEIIKRKYLHSVSFKNYPALHALLKEKEVVGSLAQMPTEEILLRWINFHLKKSGYEITVESLESEALVSDSLL